MPDHNRISADRLYPDADERALEGGWTLLLSEPDRYAGPGGIDRRAAHLAAAVPGTVAEALTKAGLFDPENPQALNNRDAWYFRSLEGEASGPAVLRFAGLATIADVFVNGNLVLRSTSMFESHDLGVTLTGKDELAICFRALGPQLDKRGPRARWRPQMMDSQGLRLHRTTLLGHMPGWCPNIHAVGPWRPISLVRPGHYALSGLKLTADYDETGTGKLRVSFDLEDDATEIHLACADHETRFEKGEDGRLQACLDIPGIKPWWPRTHGQPCLHTVALRIDGRTLSLGLTGFRRIGIDRGSDGRDFAISVNGERIFCRGAVWTSADIVRLPGAAEDYARWLAQAADAGMNMIRIGGTMAYESADFFMLCDQLGLMVWQDLMFANFDYPAADSDFSAHVDHEVRQFLGSTQMSPSLAILCGGSEIYQQAAMLGLPESSWKGPLTEEVLPAITAQLRPATPYIANSPSGGAMPFAPNEGVTHYYGVGAYCRPLDDARRANVRFAAESLAFAHVPQQRTLDAHLPVPPVIDPRWKARVPRDRGASWDFEDIRDHYLRELYRLDPARLRREDPRRYLDLSRAVTGEVSEQTFAEWRSHGSSCNGAMVWTLQDLQPGAGWGVIDSTGEPKPIWYALKRAFRPLQVLLIDEGTNGVDVHLINETAQSQHLEIEVLCLRDGQQTVANGKRAVELPARGKQKIACTDLFGAFFDTGYAFRFGPPSHDVTVARLRDVASGTLICEAFHFPQGHTAAFHDSMIEARVVQENGSWFADLSTDRLAQSVHIELDAFSTDDDWFHLSPGPTRRIALRARPGIERTVTPTGEVASIGSKRIIRF
ncbi:MAG: glycosyl hydrolase 2 galactose-binding domain-containing protein [Allorhizobium sp.]